MKIRFPKIYPPLINKGTPLHFFGFHHRWREVVLGVVVILLILKAYGFRILPAKRYDPGVLIDEDPVQIATSKPSWNYQGYTIIPQAEYLIKGRVLEFGKFFFTNAASLSPVDLTLGWKVMSDQATIDKIRFTHAPRKVFISIIEPSSYSYEHLSRNFSNNHLIPANSKVKSFLNNADYGDLIELKGYLVRIEGNGMIWQGSLSRDDTGDGACEVMWVDEASELKLPRRE